MGTDDELTTLSLAILGLVASLPSSGYDIRKAFAETPMGNFSSSPGAIYPALRRLERNGLVRGRIEHPHELRPRQVFSLTDGGRDALKRELSRAVTRDDVARREGRLLLRFALMEPMLGRAAAVGFLEALAEEAAAYAAELRELARRQRRAGATSGALAVEHGMESYRATARWARRAIKRLQQEEGGTGR